MTNYDEPYAHFRLRAGIFNLGFDAVRAGKIDIS